MITRLEIDGFKSFKDFSVDLKPFQILIGANGVGKSNLFDAIVLLSKLAGDNTLYDAFRSNRGEIWELFTLYPNGERANQIKLGVEMLIERSISDSFGVEVEVSSTRLRYELHIERKSEDGFERLFVIHESLTHITEEADRWFRDNIPTQSRKHWIVRKRNSAYISTEKGYISKHQEKRQGARKRETPLGRVERTLLSTINNTEYPTVYAARQEMLNWRFFQFNPEQLRTPSSVYAPTYLMPDGSNLATVLNRMTFQDEYVLSDISNRMANIIPGIFNIRIDTLKDRQEYMVNATTMDNIDFSSHILSDGTLRVLALVTLSHDPSHQGVMCFEEPENGVHPLRLEQIIQLLEALSTKFDAEIDQDAKLRQVIVNTHSPRLLSCADWKSFLFVYMSNLHNQPRLTRISEITDKLFTLKDEALRQFTIAQIRQFLESDDQQGLLAALEQVKAHL
jgi:predicted ATPase